MNEQKWQPGDLVGVKSGGPTMTVAGEDEIGRVICEWFDGKKPMNACFNAAVLEKRLSMSDAIKQANERISG